MGPNIHTHSQLLVPTYSCVSLSLVVICVSAGAYYNLQLSGTVDCLLLHLKKYRNRY